MEKLRGRWETACQFSALKREARRTVLGGAMERKVGTGWGITPGLPAMWAKSYFAAQSRRNSVTFAVGCRNGEELRQSAQGKAVRSWTATATINKRLEEQKVKGARVYLSHHFLHCSGETKQLQFWWKYPINYRCSMFTDGCTIV